MGAQEQQRATVGLARGDSVRDAVTQAVSLAGGLGFIRPGQTVLVKPNVVCPAPYPATTNPEVLYEVVRLVWERDPRRVMVGDRAGFRDTTPECMKKTGIHDAAREARAEVIYFEDGPWRRVQPEGAKHWERGFSVTGFLSVPDHIITLPVIKTHYLSTFSMSLKNAVGLIPPEQRLETLHGGYQPHVERMEAFRSQDHAEPRFGSLIAEINLAVTPSFVIMDGTRAFVRGGPVEGEIAEPRLIVASSDRIANDAVGLAILKILGTTPAIMERGVWEQPQIKRAVELGLGVKGAAQIDLESHRVPELERIRKHLEG